MEKITKEDVYRLIASSAMEKMDFLDDDETYIGNNGEEYGKWDVPVFIMLHGTASQVSYVQIMNTCVINLTTNGFGIDPNLLNKAYQTVVEKCQPEVDAIRETDRRFDVDDNPIDIFNDIKALLTFAEDVYEDPVD